MVEERKNSVEIAVWLVLAVGVILLLDAMHSGGVSLEHLQLAFKLTFTSGTGAVIVVAAGLSLAMLHGRHLHHR